MAQSEQVHALLIDVEAHLRQIGLWQAEPPSPKALASAQPFCFDTLGFDQWLQFIFLPTMYSLLESGQPLPTECGIAPMAQEYFRGSEMPTQALERTLAAIDHVLSGADPAPQ